MARRPGGYTKVQRASDVRGINEFLEEGATLGDLWMEGHFGLADPLVNEGQPIRPPRERQR